MVVREEKGAGAGPAGAHAPSPTRLFSTHSHLTSHSSIPPARRPASTTATLPSAAPAAPAASTAATITPIAAGLSPPARRALALWLGGCAAWTASMVALGGATRLTRSGLSMTDWKFTGERPPGTLSEWEAEFGKYKASPEYKRVNR